MRLTKMGHACVRLEKDGRILVIDPGTLTEPEALDRAEAVLITHEHFDHVEVARVKLVAQRTPQLDIWTTSAVAEQLGGVGPRFTRSAGATDSMRPGSMWASSVNSTRWSTPPGRR